jgi:hypothetical protein
LPVLPDGDQDGEGDLGGSAAVSARVLELAFRVDGVVHAGRWLNPPRIVLPACTSRGWTAESVAERDEVDCPACLDALARTCAVWAGSPEHQREDAMIRAAAERKPVRVVRPDRPIVAGSLLRWPSLRENRRGARGSKALVELRPGVVISVPVGTVEPAFHVEPTGDCPTGVVQLSRSGKARQEGTES